MHEPLVVEAVLESQLRGVAFKVVELVHVDPVAVVGDDLNSTAKPDVFQ